MARLDLTDKHFIHGRSEEHSGMCFVCLESMHSTCQWQANESISGTLERWIVLGCGRLKLRLLLLWNISRCRENSTSATTTCGRACKRRIAGEKDSSTVASCCCRTPTFIRTRHILFPPHARQFFDWSIGALAQSAHPSGKRVARCSRASHRKERNTLHPVKARLTVLVCGCVDVSPSSTGYEPKDARNLKTLTG